MEAIGIRLEAIATRSCALSRAELQKQMEFFQEEARRGLFSPGASTCSALAIYTSIFVMSYDLLLLLSHAIENNVACPHVYFLSLAHFCAKYVFFSGVLDACQNNI